MASSKFTIYSALAADIAIAITKFIAAIVTSSSAMLAEGIHSLIDSVNQILLLIGIKKVRSLLMRTALSAMARNYISGLLLFLFCYFASVAAHLFTRG